MDLLVYFKSMNKIKQNIFFLQNKLVGTALALVWGPPAYDGGAIITEYEIDMTAPDNSTRTVYKGRGTECVVASLLPGRPYLFQVMV